MPTSVIGCVTGALPTRTSPAVCLRSPATISISVLLPQPDAPTTEMNSPAAISTLIGFSARNGLSVSSPNTLATLRIEMGTPEVAAAVADEGLMRCATVRPKLAVLADQPRRPQARAVRGIAGARKTYLQARICASGGR